MKSRRKSIEIRVSSLGRNGLVAVTELVVIVSVLAGLFLLGTQMFSNISQEAASSGGISKAVSNRTVYRLSLNHEGDRLWVYRPREQLVQLELPTAGVRQSIPLAGYDIQVVAHSGDGNTTIVCSVDGSVYLWRDGEEIAQISNTGVKDTPIDVAVSSTGEMSVCVTSLGTVSGWACESQSPQAFRYTLPEGAPVQKVGVNQCGQQLTVARADGTVSFHEATTGRIIAPPLKLESECSMFVWSNDERYLAVASGRGFARVYDMSSRMIVANFDFTRSECSDRPTAIALSSDGQWMVVSTNTMPGIFIGNLQTGEHGKLLGHDGIVRCLEFSPRSDRLYSGSYDGTVREWSPVTRQQIRIVD